MVEKIMHRYQDYLGEVVIVSEIIHVMVKINFQPLTKSK